MLVSPVTGTQRLWGKNQSQFVEFLWVLTFLSQILFVSDYETLFFAFPHENLHYLLLVDALILHTWDLQLFTHILLVGWSTFGHICQLHTFLKMHGLIHVPYISGTYHKTPKCANFWGKVWVSGGAKLVFSARLPKLLEFCFCMSSLFLNAA